MIIELKNAIRDAIVSKNAGMNFYFEEIKTAKYPYAFLYFPSYAVASFDEMQTLSVLCVVEYQLKEECKNAELWSFCTNLQAALMPYIPFLNGHVYPEIVEFKVVAGVLQMSFSLNFSAREYDIIEFMEELDLTINSNLQINYTEEV